VVTIGSACSVRLMGRVIVGGNVQLTGTGTLTNNVLVDGEYVNIGEDNSSTWLTV